MLDTVAVNIKRVPMGRFGISKAKIAVIAVVAFLTLSFFAIGFSAVEQARGSPAVVQQTAEDGDNAAVSAFKFV